MKTIVSHLFQNFEFFEICNLTPESGNEFSWHLQEFHGSWKGGLNAGGCLNNVTTFHQNPQFLIELEDSDDGGFQLLDLIITELKSHMNCYNSMPFIG